LSSEESFLAVTPEALTTIEEAAPGTVDRLLSLRERSMKIAEQDQIDTARNRTLRTWFAFICFLVGAALSGGSLYLDAEWFSAVPIFSGSFLGVWLRPPA